MLYSRLIEVIRLVADFTDDTAVTATTEQYVRCLDVPGPVVAIVGASGRGKSTLLAHITGCEKPQEGAGVTVASASAWNGFSDLPFHCIVERAALSVMSNMLVCDTPALDKKPQRETVEQIVERADLVIFVVQVTQPTGAEEVQFAQRMLCDKPVVLVVSKVDLADEEDFAEAYSAIQTAYDVIPWQEVLTASRDMQGDSLYELRTFDEWWQRDGGNLVARLHKERMQILRHKCLNAAQYALTVREDSLAAELEQTRFTIERDEVLQQAMELQTAIHDRIADLSRQAVQQYTSAFPEMRTQITACADNFLETAEIGKHTDTNALEAAIQSAIAEWDTRTRSHVLTAMHEPVTRLKTDCERFTELARQLNYKAQEALSREVRENSVAHVEAVLPEMMLPPAVLNDLEMFGPMVILGVGGMAIGIGIDILLASTMGIILAPLILVFGKIIYDELHKTIGDGPRRRVAALIQRSVQAIAPRLEPRLAENFQNAWDGLCHELEIKLHPYERSLRTYRTVTARMDESLRPRHLALLQHLREIENLREDLYNEVKHHNADGENVYA